MSRRTLSRRTLLRGAGVCLPLPLLQAMGDKAYAAPVKRLIVYFHHQGTFLDRWRPATTGTGYKMSAILSPLEPWRQHVNVLSGIGNPAYETISEGGDAHGVAYVSTMTANTAVNPSDRKTGSAGPSIENVIATRIQGTARLRALNLAIGLRGKPLFWSAPGQSVGSEGDPRVVFKRLFGEGTKPADVMAPVKTTRQRLLEHRPSIADSVLSSFKQIRTQLGSEDQIVLDRHISSISETEKNWSSTPSMSGAAGACMPPALDVPAGDHEERAVEPAIARAQILNCVAALVCDQTRVVTLVHSHEDRQTFPWLDQGLPGPYENWHALIHQRGGTKVDAATKAFTWYTEQLAFLLSRLAATPDGAGTLLDNTMILGISDFGDGSRHQPTNLPILLAGGAGGALKGGRHLDFSGRSTNELFTTMLNIFGFDDKRFGLADSAINRGPLAL